MAESNYKAELKERVLENQFIYCARRDFKVAEMLNANTTDSSKRIDRCNIIFHLEQSTEKLNKFLFLVLFPVFGKITNDDNLKINNILEKFKSKKIGHNQAKLFLELIFNTKKVMSGFGITDPNKFSKMLFAEVGIDFPDIEKINDKQIKILSEKMNQIASMSKKKINKQLDNADKLVNKLRMPSKEKMDILAVTNKIESSINQEAKELIEEDTKNREKKFNISKDEMYNETFNLLWPLIERFPRLVSYGLVLSPHESSTRYPDGLIPVQEYDLGEAPISGIYILRRMIAGLKEFFDEIDKISRS